MASTSELLISITANAGSANAVLNELMQQTRLLEAGFGSTGAAVEQASAKTTESVSAFGKLSESFASVGKMAMGMATGMLVADVTMSVAERFKSAAEAIDTYGQAALTVQRITGESAEASSTLVAIFDRYSPSLDEATTRLARFEKSLAGQSEALDVATTGGKSASQWLEHFGVSATDATGNLRPTTEILYDLAAGFQKAGTSADEMAAKNMALNTLMGRGSQSMLLMFDQGRARIAALEERLEPQQTPRKPWAA
jgi:hypothetical protein